MFSVDTPLHLPHAPPLPLVAVPLGLGPLVEDLVDGAHVGAVEREGCDAQVVGHVRGVPRPDDDGGHDLLVQHPARGHIGDGHAVLLGDAVQRPQQLLEPRPPARLADHARVLLLGVRVQLNLARVQAQVTVGQEAPRHDPVGQQRDPVGLAELRHGVVRAAVEQAVLDLVGRDGHPAVEHVLDAGHVEVGEADVHDLALGLLLREVLGGLDVVGGSVGVPVELQVVDLAHPQPRQGAVHVGSHVVPGHVAHLRPHAAELGVDLDAFGRGARAAQVVPDDFLRVAVAACLGARVEGVDAGVHKGLEVLQRR
mmetsp:Transcript_54401/g.172848  ORF Transcript_54401/g.172848 Transcript_54401/m.172848 type:complete len:311 (+) Transcript_54401:13-945(+)